MAKATQIIKTETSYDYSISIKSKSGSSGGSSNGSSGNTGKGQVTCHMCDGRGTVPASWYTGKKK